ncbi:hypothetical protein [Bifidobacterium moukalabense]|nr:hypothetical protein [Bifidobacterium moukalabense]
MTSAGLTKELLALHYCGMIRMTTGMGGELAFVQNLYAPGFEHYDQILVS